MKNTKITLKIAAAALMLILMLTLSACGECEHSWDAGTVAKAATHTEEGEMLYTCTKCRETRTEPIAKSPEHSFDEGVITQEATHTQDCIKTYTCTGCGFTRSETVSEKLGHEFGIWTAADEQFHTRSCSCGETETAEHRWDEGKVTKKATTSKKGEMTYTCLDCGAKKKAVIEKLTNTKDNTGTGSDNGSGTGSGTGTGTGSGSGSGTGSGSGSGSGGGIELPIIFF